MVRFVFAAALASLPAFVTAPAAGQGKSPTSAPHKPERKAAAGPTEAQVLDAIARGLKYLYATQNADGAWDTKYTLQHPGGMAALGLLTALSAGEKIETPQLAKALQYVKGVRPETVYARAMRAMVYCRLPGSEYIERATADIQWLLKYQDESGGWGYGPAHPTTKLRKDWTDGSNSQLVVLALQDAADRGIPIPAEAWTKAIQYWTVAQNADGGWGYEPPGKTGIRLRGSSYGSMSAAGVASFYVFAGAPGVGRAVVGADDDEAALPPPLMRGLAWLEANYAVNEVPKWSWGKREDWLYYYLFCVARVAESGGLRHLGPHDLSGALAAFLVSQQRRDGSWSSAAEGETQGEPIHTCFALLALLKTSSPILIHKMLLTAKDSVTGEAAGFLRWYSGLIGRTAGWKTVSPDDAAAVTEAPVLLIRGKGVFNPPADLGAPLEAYLRTSGTVLVQAFRGDPAFAASAEKYFAELLPDYRVEDCKADHPIFSAGYKISPDKLPKIRGIGDYTRTRAFIVLSPLTGHWTNGYTTDYAASYQFGFNLLNYATDVSLPRTRFSRPPAPAAPIETDRYIPVARVQHDGDWNTNPMALTRLSDAVAEAISIGVRQTPRPTDLTQTLPETLPLLWLTGSVPPEFTPDQLQQLEKYLRNGGTLFADAAVGNKAFADAVAGILKKQFGESCLVPLGPDHPVLSGQFGGGLGGQIAAVQYTRAVQAESSDPKPAKPVLYGVEVNGRTAVIFSPYGITCPLEGGPAYGCRGLATSDALRLAANVVLYAAVGKPVRQVVAAEKN